MTPLEKSDAANEPAPRVRLAVAEQVPVELCVIVKVSIPDIVVLSDVKLEVVSAGVRVTEGVSEPVGVTETEGISLIDMVAVLEMLQVSDELAPKVTEAVGVELSVGVVEPVSEGDAALRGNVDEPVADGDAVKEDVKLPVTDINGVGRGVDCGVYEPLNVVVGLSLLDGEEEGVGTADGVALALPPNVGGGVSDVEEVAGRRVGVVVNVSELVIVVTTLALELGVTVREPVNESEPVSALDDEVVSVAEILLVTVAVILLDCVCEDEGVCVCEDEGVAVTELVSEDDKLEEIDAVTLGEIVLLGVEDVDAPRVTVLETVPVPVPLPDGVTVMVMLGVGVIVTRGVEGGVESDVGEVVEKSVPDGVRVAEDEIVIGSGHELTATGALAIIDEQLTMRIRFPSRTWGDHSGTKITPSARTDNRLGEKKVADEFPASVLTLPSSVNARTKLLKESPTTK